MAFKNRLDSGMASLSPLGARHARRSGRTHPGAQEDAEPLECRASRSTARSWRRSRPREIEKQKVIPSPRSMIDDGFINQAGKKWDEILEGPKKAEDLRPPRLECVIENGGIRA